MTLRPALLSFSFVLLHLMCGCTVHHSRQAAFLHPQSGYETPSPQARFITEEDSGLSILGLFVLAEPDHYAVLLERARRDHRCRRLMYPQFDFYTDHWLLIAFPISRVTLVCEPEVAVPSEHTVAPTKQTPTAPPVALEAATSPKDVLASAGAEHSQQEEAAGASESR